LVSVTRNGVVYDATTCNSELNSNDRGLSIDYLFVDKQTVNRNIKCNTDLNDAVTYSVKDNPDGTFDVRINGQIFRLTNKPSANSNTIELKIDNGLFKYQKGV
jgi:hypothetical protein